MHVPGRIKDAAKQLRSWCVDLGDYRTTTFIAGTGRSGTTWLEEVIDFSHDHRVVFEPFHAAEVPQLKHWHYRQYLRPSDNDPRFLEPARRILAGRFHNLWADQFNRKHVASKRLIKDIRANLMLRWIREYFPEIPIVLLMRHPCAVARSKLALKWQTHLGVFLDQPALVEDYLSPFVPLIESTHDAFDCHILLWCIENWIPLTQFNAGEIHVCFYEDFCTQPEREARALLEYLQRPFDTSLLQSMSKPSALTRDHSALRTGGSVLDSWQAHVSEDRVARANELLGHFGLDQIYGAGTLPKVDRASVLGLFKQSTIPKVDMRHSALAPLGALQHKTT